ncbi:Transposase [Caloramator quimbayensis]|uniref:Transposase n=1 Tax=Caloramator quimbayensis TaxID=1147123 RepID=A0A1T4WGY4_9CLOT|nr:ISL3 family transposase [Caloramator quimbayensis]SKA76606.1 Transposase [Caloramator quimbayensis]
MTLDLNFIQSLIGLQDLEVTSANVIDGIVYIYAESKHNFAVCPKCKKITQTVHDSRRQPYKHLPVWDKETIIILTKKRYVCSCDPEHPFDESFSFIRRYQRITTPYEKYIFSLMLKSTVKNAHEITGISEATCQSIYNFYANSILENRNPESLRLLGIDDIATKKGHNYDTVIYNHETGNVVAVITGRKKEDVISYLHTIPMDVREGIQAVSMDMSRGYCHSVLECFPNAKPVIDRFHISQQLHKNVDDARKHIQNHIKKNSKKNEVFKIRWALLKNVEDLKHDEALRLILSCTKYEKIYELHYLKEEFREFFNITSKEDAIAFHEYYKDFVYEYDIPELKIFCKTIDNWMPYILNYYDFPISNGPTEGNNHKIKNIKRRAYGYRNHNNFELRVKMEFECA